MVCHQINADGAGPVSCSVSADASGKTFTAMKVTTQVPGTNGRSTATSANFPLVADMPAGTVCIGTVSMTANVCLVKCENPVGPFGSVVPVQMPVGKWEGCFAKSRIDIWLKLCQHLPAYLIDLTEAKGLCTQRIIISVNQDSICTEDGWFFSDFHLFHHLPTPRSRLFAELAYIRIARL